MSGGVCEGYRQERDLQERRQRHVYKKTRRREERGGGGDRTLFLGGALAPQT